MTELTTREILDLAEFAGLSVEHNLSEEELDCEYYLHTGLSNGIEVYDEYGETSNFYKNVVTCDGCWANEVYPLGKPIND